MYMSSILYRETISGEEIFELMLMKTNIQLIRWDGIFGKLNVLCNELFTGMSSPLERAADNVSKTIFYMCYEVKE